MKIFEGKSPQERNKIIAAVVLGALALFALGYNLIGFFPSSKKTVTVNLTPTPTPASSSGGGDRVVTALPNQSEIERIYSGIPISVVYPPYAPDAGRNIFAFYEPPVPTPFVPPPPTTPKTPTPIPDPTPNVLVSYISRQSVYAGEKGFRLEVGGDKFTPETYIFFNGNQLPTNFVNPQQLSADIPANFIATEGQRNIVVQSANREFWSNPVTFNVQEPPRPQFEFVGVVSRKRGNNDTAYIQEKGKQTPPVSARLNDVLGGRFRLVSIAPTKLMVQDVNLGFLHAVEIVKGTGQSYGGSTRTNPSFNDGNNYQRYQDVPPQQCPPGIPCNTVPRYVPPTPQPNPQQKKDADDEDDEDGDN